MLSIIRVLVLLLKICFKNTVKNSNCMDLFKLSGTTNFGGVYRNIRMIFPVGSAMRCSTMVECLCLV